MRFLLTLILILMSGNAFAGFKVTSGDLLVPAGNVGVGSATPRAKMDVDGSVYATAYYGSGANLTGVSSADIYWTGTATNLVAATGRTSLEMGSIYPLNAGTMTNAQWCKYNSAGTSISCDVAPVVDTNTNAGTICTGGDVYLNGEGQCVTIDETIYQVAGTYITGATASRGLVATTTTLGLIETCNSGELLKWNGSIWACATDTTGASSGTPGGSSTQIQYNNAGALGGVDGFVYNGTALSYTGNIGLGSVNPTQKLDVNGTVKATTFSGALSGNASTATALAADPANCPSSGLAGGVTAAGVAEGCYTVSGSGTVVALATAPVFTTPNIGVSTATSVNKVTITAPATSATLTILDGKTLTATSTVNLNTMTDAKWCKYSTSGTALDCNVEPVTAPTAANPSGTIGLTAVNGSSANFMRADGAPALGVAISPTWTGNHTFTPSSGNTVITAGNVGIGTTTANAELEVNGAFYAGSGAPSPTWGGVSMASAGDAYFKGDLEVDGTIYTDATGDTLLNVTSGNVGIGTANALAQLHIDGTIYSQNLTVGGSHGAAKLLCLGIDGVIYGVSSGGCF